MKTPDQSDNDRQLSKLLHEWKPEASLPPRFQEGVWRRIERLQAPNKTSAWEIVSHWIGNLLPRPAMAAAYVAVLLTVGATVGLAQAHQTNERVKGELGDRYVRVLDPYQAPRE